MLYRLSADTTLQDTPATYGPNWEAIIIYGVGFAPWLILCSWAWSR
jgi:hypothetical protein